MSEDSVDEGVDAPTTISLDIPIDGEHEPFVTELRNAGMDVEGVLEQQLSQPVETRLYQLRQQIKYSQSE